MRNMLKIWAAWWQVVKSLYEPRYGYRQVPGAGSEPPPR